MCLKTKGGYHRYSLHGPQNGVDPALSAPVTKTFFELFADFPTINITKILRSLKQVLA